METELKHIVDETIDAILDELYVLNINLIYLVKEERFEDAAFLRDNINYYVNISNISIEEITGIKQFEGFNEMNTQIFDNINVNWQTVDKKFIYSDKK